MVYEIFFSIAVLCFITAFFINKRKTPQRYVQLESRAETGGKELSLVKSEELGPTEIRPAEEEQIVVEKKKKKEWAPLAFFKE